MTMNIFSFLLLGGLFLLTWVSAQETLQPVRALSRIQRDSSTHSFHSTESNIHPMASGDGNLTVSPSHASKPIVVSQEMPSNIHPMASGENLTVSPSNASSDNMASQRIPSNVHRMASGDQTLTQSLNGGASQLAGVSSILILDSESMSPYFSFYGPGWVSSLITGNELPWINNHWVLVLSCVLLCIGGVDLITFTAGQITSLTSNLYSSPFSSRKGFLSLSITLVYLALRCVLYLPFLLRLLPILSFQGFPILMHQISFIFFLVSLTLQYLLPIIFTLYYTFQFGLGNKASLIWSIKEFPTVVIMVIVTDQDNLCSICSTIQSLVQCNYPVDKLSLWITFDDDEESGTFTGVMRFMGDNEDEFNSMVQCVYEGLHVTVNRFAKSGKRAAQVFIHSFIHFLFYFFGRGTFRLLSI